MLYGHLASEMSEIQLTAPADILRLSEILLYGDMKRVDLSELKHRSGHEDG